MFRWKLDHGRRRHDERRVSGNGRGFGSLGADAAVRWRGHLRDCFRHLRKRYRVNEPNRIGVIAHAGLAVDGRPRWNSHGIHRTPNRRPQSVAGHHHAESGADRIDGDEHGPLPDDRNVICDRNDNVFEWLLNATQSGGRQCD
jgi:hypothetical protein